MITPTHLYHQCLIVYGDYMGNNDNYFLIDHESPMIYERIRDDADASVISSCLDHDNIFYHPMDIIHKPRESELDHDTWQYDEQY